MALTLTDDSLPARTVKKGSTTVTVPAGKYLKIETTPGGSEELNHKFSDSDDYVVSINVYAKKA